jgi:hypothetical protein
METTEKQAGVEVTSVRVPRFVAALTPTMPEVPANVMFPLTSGVDELGRTRMPCQVNVLLKKVLLAVTARVIVDAVTDDTAKEVPEG